MNKLSVIIITKNEEKNIRRCLESIRWADEIVVVDSFSNDKTVAICREFTDKVFQKNFTAGFAKALGSKFKKLSYYESHT